MPYETHLYAILFPTSALVGSHLNPQDFARHFSSGTSKYSEGKLIFVELDSNYRHPYFQLEEQLKELTPHEDGRPRATKYFSTYRVLEHIDYSALGTLYISSPEGHVIALPKGEYVQNEAEAGKLRVYAEIAPVSTLILSGYNFLEYSKFITAAPYGAPKMLYTQVDFEADEFLTEYQNTQIPVSPIPDIHPAILCNAIQELGRKKDKHAKALSLRSPLGKISMRMLRHGLMFASQNGNVFYPFPTMAEIEKQNRKFWRAM